MIVAALAEDWRCGPARARPARLYGPVSALPEPLADALRRPDPGSSTRVSWQDGGDARPWWCGSAGRGRCGELELLMARGNGTVLRDVLDIKEDAHAGDFKIELSQGFSGKSAGSIAEYVVTPQLAKEFDKALRLVRDALRKNTSYAAYLHGSFGAGKSHFLTVLHAVLNGDPAAQTKERLGDVVTGHQDWLRDKKFLMVPFHLVGYPSLEGALLGGYADAVRKLHPDEATPLVFRADSLLADARNLRASIGDEAFLRLLPAPRSQKAPVPPAAPASGDDEAELRPIGTAPAQGWTAAALDAALDAPAGDPGRDQLVTALFDGPMKSYAGSTGGEEGAYVPLDDGLSEISKHAKGLGYQGVVLFLDELVLWLQAKMSDRTFINEQIQKTVKLIETTNPDRPVPIISFVSRQRDLSQLVGKDVLGSDVENLNQALQYLEERFEVINLEDRNLPEIIKERVLRPRPGQEAVLDAAFAGIDRTSQIVKDVLLDGDGATGSRWEDFRSVYPLSPALLNVLVALSGALQRERSGLKLVQQLMELNADTELGNLIPLGDLWDVLIHDTGTAFTDKLSQESESATRFHAKARAHLLEKYGTADHIDFRADERFVKTLLLAALAPDVPALRRLTGTRLAALNHGSVRSRTVPVGERVRERMKALQLEFPAELRAEGGDDPVFSIHLSDLDVEPILNSVVREDKTGVRQSWARERMRQELGLGLGNGEEQLLDTKKIIWRGSERTVEFFFGSVHSPVSITDEQFTVSEPGRIRIIFDYPFDESHRRSPDDAYHRVQGLINGGHDAPVLVWLSDYLSEQRKAQLGRLMRINFLLERDRLSEYTRNFLPEERTKARNQLERARETLTETLAGALSEVYGLTQAKEGTVGAEVTDGRHLLSLQPEHPRPQPPGSRQFPQAVTQLADGLFSAMYDKHPDFGPGAGSVPKAVSQNELNTALKWITLALGESDTRIEVDSKDLRAVRRVVEPLGLGTVHEGPLILKREWWTRINQVASLNGQKDAAELSAEDIRRWITRPAEDKGLGYRGLDKQITSLLIAVYALLDNRTWEKYGAVEAAPPLNEIGPGWSLRAKEMPGEEEYAAARTRAGRLFGVPAKPALFARNVHELAAGVHAKATAHEKSVGDVRSVLKRHAVLLGLDAPEQAPRTESLHTAAALLARLVRHGDDPTALVRELAALSYETPDLELSHTMDSAAELAAALDGTDWALLERVRKLSARDDTVGDRAQRFLDRIREAARDTEKERSLIPVLKEVRESAHALMDAALQLEPPAPAPGPQPPVDAEQVPLSRHGIPPVPSKLPDPGPSQQLRIPPADERSGDDSRPEDRLPAAPHVVHAGPSGAAELPRKLTAVREEIEAYRAAHPDAAVRIVWQVVGDGTVQTGEGEQG